MEVYRILDDDDFAKKQKRKQRKLKKKAAATNATTTMEVEDENDNDNENDDNKVPIEPQFSDRIQYHTTFHFSKKTRAFTFYSTLVKGRRAHNYFAVNYHNNNVDLYSFEPNASSQLEMTLV